MSVTHETFTIERVLHACPAHVFACWADADLKRRWFVDSDGPAWQESDHAMEFRVGGQEVGRFVLTEGPGAGTHENVTRYLDIVDGQRIVYAYTMAMNGRIHSASLATVTFADAGGGTRLCYREDGAFFAPSDGAEIRKAGWAALLASLETLLEKETAE